MTIQIGYLFTICDKDSFWVGYHSATQKLDSFPIGYLFTIWDQDSFWVGYQSARQIMDSV